MSYSSLETVRVTVEGPLAIVTIAREAQRNALSSKVIAELTQVAGELELSDDVRVVAVTGAGDKAFVAGADIAEMAELTPLQAQAFAEMGGNLGQAIEGSRLPWIAAVNGFALGGGCELALCCDFIYAADTARLGQPEVKLGVIPGFGGTQRLLRRVGVAKARELVYTGSTIDAETAAGIGLVNEVVPHDELLPRARAVAEQIAQMGPIAVREAKRAILEGEMRSLHDANAIEIDAFARCFTSADQKEGMDAFLAKRAPAFTGK